MTDTIKFAWEAIKLNVEKFQAQDAAIQFREDRFDAFDQMFRMYYNDVMERFMRDTKELDAHKQAAIIVISCLEAEIIEHSVEDDCISIVPQLIALDVGLSYMNDRLNEKLAKKHLPSIDEYKLPIAIACETPYIEVMSRLLYYEQTEGDMKFNILELADRLFLIEYINLLQSNIEPDLLRESSRN